MKFYFSIIYKSWGNNIKASHCILAEKVSLIQEYYFLMVFLYAGIKFRESRRMLSLKAHYVISPTYYQVLKVIHSQRLRVDFWYLSDKNLEWSYCRINLIYWGSPLRSWAFYWCSPPSVPSLSLCWFVTTLLIFNIDFPSPYPLSVGTFCCFILAV